MTHPFFNVNPSNASFAVDASSGESNETCANAEGPFGPGLGVGEIRTPWNPWNLQHM